MVVFDGCGGEYPARISKISNDRVEVTLSEPRHPPTESPVDITLAQGLIRGERMDLVLQKATELGVSRIVPVAMERCVTRLSRQRLAKRMPHWQKVVIGTCEQCGRTVLPVIESLQSSAELIDSATQSEYPCGCCCKQMQIPGSMTSRNLGAAEFSCGSDLKAVSITAKRRRQSQKASAACAWGPGCCAPRPPAWSV